MARSKSPDDDERPWTEEQWEAFMRRNDLRADRFGELMETLIDDPDRHAKISHEMGWDKPAEGEDEEADARRREFEEIATDAQRQVEAGEDEG